MKPILFYIGSFPVHAYSLVLLLGMASGFYVLRRDWKEAGFESGSVCFFCAGAILCSLLGGRLGYIALHVSEYVAGQGHSSPLWQMHGVAAWGAIGALLVWTWVYARRLGVSNWELFDVLAPPAALAEAIVRCGCLLNGCCYGRAATGFPAMVLPDLDGRWMSRYPTQILYSAVALGLFVLLWTGRRRKLFAGFPTLMYVTFYAAGRLAVGPLRGDYTTAQSRLVSLGLDLALLGVGLGSIFWQVRQARQGREGTA